jgi:phosphoglycerate dehydrogenase-like enzyme
LAPRLKLIQKIGSGVNTIDVEAAKRRSIAVCNLPGTNSRAVAEMTLLLVLACLRRLPSLHGAVIEGRWGDAWRLQDRFGELAGRSVGLVGYGAVPKILHPILEAMGGAGAVLVALATNDKPYGDRRRLRHRFPSSPVVRRHSPHRESLTDEARRDPHQHRARRPGR